jgi:hypothetical protein
MITGSFPLRGNERVARFAGFPGCGKELRWFALLGLLGALGETAAQPVLLPWGNLAGMRVNGEMVDFEGGVRVVASDWTGFSGAVKYLQRPEYARSGDEYSVSSRVEGVAFKARVAETGPGEASLHLTVTLEKAAPMSGVYFCVEAHYAADDAVELLGTGGVERVADGRAAGVEAKPHQRLEASGARWTGPNRWLEVVMAGKTELTVRRDHWDWPTRLNDPSIRQKFVVESADDAGMQVYFKLLPADAAPGEQAEVTFTIRAGARRPSDVVQLVLDATKPGRAFDGIGGNFRLQFPATDPAVIEYNLDHLPVAWSRVAMPWIEWDRDETQDPLALARSGTLDQRVHEAMELARELARRRIPVIVSAWGPPMWARALNQPPGLRGTALNPDKLERVYGSIASYLVFLKEHYGGRGDLLFVERARDRGGGETNGNGASGVFEGTGSASGGAGVNDEAVVGRHGACHTLGVGVFEANPGGPQRAWIYWRTGISHLAGVPGRNPGRVGGGSAETGRAVAGDGGGP